MMPPNPFNPKVNGLAMSIKEWFDSEVWEEFANLCDATDETIARIAQKLAEEEEE